MQVMNTQWTSITLHSEYSQPATFYPGATIKFWPLQYGTYKVTIVFPDKKTAWLEYRHYDAGVRKRAEMIIERLPDGDSLHIAQIYNKSERVDGTIQISRTSEDKPIHIDGPAG